jgi:hypothetical protein
MYVMTCAQLAFFILTEYRMPLLGYTKKFHITCVHSVNPGRVGRCPGEVRSLGGDEESGTIGYYCKCEWGITLTEHFADYRCISSLCFPSRRRSLIVTVLIFTLLGYVGDCLTDERLLLFVVEGDMIMKVGRDD